MRQTARVLERVKAGESLEVREHGRPIARLVPVLANTSMLERLVSEGRAIAAANRTALFAEVPPSAPGEPSLSAALESARDAERR